MTGASQLLAELAAQRGLRVQRLSPGLVVCAGAGRRRLFYDLAGPGVGRAASALCGNLGWLRDTLARAGLPVVPTKLVAVTDPEAAQAAAETLGFPLTVTPLFRASLVRADHGPRDMIGPGEGPQPHDRQCGSAELFPALWRTLAAEATSPRDHAILQRRPAGSAREVAVVAGAVVASQGSTMTGVDGAEAVDPVAVAAIAALPEVAYGSVRLIETPAGPVVDLVDLTFSGWAAPAGRQVAEAILAHEID